MNSNSTLLAAAVSSLVALNAAPVRAADPGKACCAGLDERVAELETTSARKDNRAVALSITGEVSRALLIWDDGARPDADGADDAAASDSAKLSLASMSGFIVELGFTDSSALFVNQAGDAGKSETSFEARLANWYVEGERTGRQSAGPTSSSSDSTAVIDLSRARTPPVTWHNASLGMGEGADYAGLAWGNVAWGLESDQDGVTGADSPIFYGFIASAAWSENDSWDVAVRFQKDLSAVHGASGAGYLWVGDESTVSLYPNDTMAASGSISAVHVPSGLFGNAGGARADFAREALASSDAPNAARMWTAQAGTEKAATTRGATTLYGGYHEVLLGYAGFNGNPSPVLAGGVTPAAATGDTDVSRWGVGTVQQFDAAAVEMHAVFNHFEASKAQPRNKKARAEPWYGVVVGSRL